MSLRRFDGKTALVAVGHERVALAIARRLAAEGANVVLLGADEGRLRILEDELSANCAVAAYGLTADVAKAREIEGALGETMRVFGGLDVLVTGLHDRTWARSDLLRNGDTAQGAARRTNGTQFRPPTGEALAGRHEPVKRQPPIPLDLDHEAFARSVQAGLQPVYALCQRTARLLVGRGREGSFVVVGEGGGLVKAMAIELAPRGIRVNGIAASLPTPTPAPMSAATTPAPGAPNAVPLSPPQASSAALQLPTPLLDAGVTADDVAAAAAFLASAAASYLVGVVLPVDAGLGAAR